MDFPRSIHVTLVLAASLVLPAVAPAAAPPINDYAVVARWPLKDTVGWDYLTADPARGRLFVTRGNGTEVIELASGRSVAEIPGNGVHGVALAPALGRGFASNGRSNSVTVFDYDTLAVLREVPVPGDTPDAILYDEASGRVFTFNARSKDATVFDAASMQVLASLPMPDKPEFAVSDGTGRVFVNIEREAGALLVIDSRRPAIVATWPLPGCISPSGLAIDAPGHRLFSVCDEKRMVVTDSSDGRQLARVPIGVGPDAVAFDPARSVILVSNGAGTLSVVRADSRTRYVVAQTLPTEDSARTLALDPVTHRVYLAAAKRGPAPAPTTAEPHPRRPLIPGSFTVLVVGPR